ncbi:MAG: DUF2975 domain-containing protein [Rhizomicrobium sp.]
MSNVVELPVVAPDTRASLLTYRSLKPLSRGLSILFTVFVGASLLWLAAAFVVIFFFADHVLLGASGGNVAFPHPPADMPGMVRFSTQPFVTRVAGLIDVVIGMIPVILVCWNLRGLFGLYARGVVFARENARHLKHIGVWLVTWPVAKLVANMLFQLAGGADKAWAQTIFLDSLVLGLIVFAIAQVMEFGREIEEEKDSFI